jgi:hypothetical protein
MNAGLSFEHWWMEVGIHKMPKHGEPPEHAAIAELAWNAALTAPQAAAPPERTSIVPKDAIWISKDHFNKLCQFAAKHKHGRCDCYDAALPSDGGGAGELLRKLAEGWIETGLHGTGLRTDEYVAAHKQAIQGIYEHCGKQLLEYLNYRSTPSHALSLERAREEVDEILRKWIDEYDSEESRWIMCRGALAKLMCSPSSEPAGKENKP